MKKIPMLERFAAQSLVEYDGELIFSKEKFAELNYEMNCTNNRTWSIIYYDTKNRN